MVGVIDIGNTNLHVGICTSDRLVTKTVFPLTTADLESAVTQFLSQKEITGAAIASVMPGMTARIADAVKRCCDTNVLVVSHAVKLPVRLDYETPETLGADRIANAVGGLVLFRRDLIVIDFGTATTFDVISREGGYFGGIIMPGIGMSADMLAERTALLEKTPVERPKRVTGRSTAECMISGVVNGAAAAASGIIRRIRAEHGRSFMAVATGGWGRFITPYIPEIKQYEENIGLYGILEIYNHNAR